jgi:hypothetical protein
MKIFIGSSSEAADKTDPDKNILLKISGILRDARAEPVLWNEQPSIFSVGRTTIENLEELVNREHIDAAVFIYSTDDKTWYRGEEKTVPRDNVVFEHGLFTGILGREKAITVKVGNVQMPSDLYGVTCIDYMKNIEHAKLNIMQWVKKLFNNTGNTNKDDISKSGNSNIETYQELKEEPSQGLIELVSLPEGVVYKRISDNQKIEINNPFAISKTLITQNIYSLIMESNPSYFRGDDLPVENVTFHDAVIFCNKLSVKEGYSEVYTVINDNILYNQSVTGYRLPFEAEWEYALGYDSTDIQESLDMLAWYNDNSKKTTHEVSKKKENGLGIFDLLGNVWEWCFDNYKDNPPQTAVLENNNKLRVLRGGSFADFKSMFTKEKAFRKKENETIRNRFTGFRVILQK